MSITMYHSPLLRLPVLLSACVLCYPEGSALVLGDAGASARTHVPTMPMSQTARETAAFDWSKGKLPLLVVESSLKTK